MVKYKLPDGTSAEAPSGATVLDAAKNIGAGLAKAAIAGKLDHKLVDLDSPIVEGALLEIVTNKSAEAADILNHSAAHVMAAAIKEIFPETKFGIGPSIDGGFYYDIDMGRSVIPEDLIAIEEKMSDIIAEKRAFSHKAISKEGAREVFANQPLKLELIEELDDSETLTIYFLGDFVDLCRGPHIPDASKVAAFKLLKAAGAYWRGDSSRQMLQRIYGTAFFSKKELEIYVTRVEEAEKRDHRKLGKELGIFTITEDAGVGLPLYPPNGARIIRLLQEWLRKELYRRGYQEVITPHIYDANVWKISGHADFYRDNMYFFQIDESEKHDGSVHKDYALKPMNCPGHVLLYRDELRSYRELPLRLFEFGTVYRHEMSGVVHGLLRARGFTQDDAHIFCTTEQIVSEVESVLDLVDFIMGTFGFEYSAEISTRPDKSIGTDEMWDIATDSLVKAIENRGVDYEINPKDGAFYGPKIDIKVKDAIGRTWQCSTVQVDFNFPERFDLKYRAASNDDERPWMLHRAIFGSMERFLGILIEHTSGSLPLWLAPTQVAIVPIADRHVDGADAIAQKIRDIGGRVEVYAQNEPMRVKIAKAQSLKIPYMLVVGDKELENNEVSVRERHEGDIGKQSIDEFLKIIEDARI